MYSNTVGYLIRQMQVILLLAETQDKLVAIIKEIVEHSPVSQQGGSLQAKEVSRRCKDELFARIV